MTIVAVESPATEGRWTRRQRAVVSVAVVVGIIARWWNLGGPGLSFDEAFTAAYSSLPLNEIPSALRANDSHPPLDYLLRHLWVGPHSELWLRVPSAVFASLALLLVVRWMRARWWLGVAVVVVFALDPFSILYAHQARMYALMSLLGVTGAFLADRWLAGAVGRAAPVLLGILVAVACLDHAGGLFLAAGLMAVPGLRRDWAAWRWRLGAVAGVAVWAVVWGSSFRQQLELQSSSWVPLTSFGSLTSTLGGLFSMVEGTDGLVVVLLVGGGAALWSLDRRLARLALALLGVPFVLLGLAGLQFHVLLPRTLAASSWAVPAALAALMVAAWRRRVALGVAVASVLVALCLRSMSTATSYDEHSSAALVAVGSALSPGDTVLVHPGWMWPLAWWNLETDQIGRSHPGVAGLEGWAWAVRGSAANGRVWIVRPDTYRLDLERFSSCGATRTLPGGWLLDCVVTGGS